MRGVLSRLGATAALLGLAVGASSAGDWTVTVRAPNRSYHETPVAALIEAPKDFAGVALFDGDAVVPVQARLVGDGKVEVAWVLHDLAKGESAHYRLALEKVSRPVAASGVIIDRMAAGDLEIRINNRLFTRYDTHTGPNKPYFYPIFGPDDRRITRRYPFERIEGESHDHPHHRGLWFTHGSVNGDDYWSEEPNAAKTVHARYDEVMSGPVYGYFRAGTNWIDRSGKKIAEDVREVHIYNVADGRLMAFDVTIRPAGAPLVFGDTKEGSFGIRLADSMTLPRGGHIEMSTGIKDNDTWGKPADWVDYYGAVDGETVGLAILDLPGSFRHPTTWHVRDYGLFAANPFGLHDFNGDRAHPHLGDYTVPANGSLTFRYLLFFHKGTTAEAHIADLWAMVTDPPQVEVASSERNR